MTPNAGNDSAIPMSKTVRAMPKQKSRPHRARVDASVGSKLREFSIDDLCRVFMELNFRLRTWIGAPTAEGLDWFKTIPRLKELVDIDALKSRLPKRKPTPSRDIFKGPHINERFPEFAAIRDQCVSEISKSPAAALTKSEAWLRAAAANATDADLESVVYCASRGRRDALTADQIRKDWHHHICALIARQPNIAPDTAARAERQEITLEEAKTILSLDNLIGVQTFWGFRDEEQIFVGATMLRTADWMQIGGFEAWWREAVDELSLGAQGSGSTAGGAYSLFYWCRSDLAIFLAARPGLEGWLWALRNGQHKRDEPWKLYDFEQKPPRERTFLPIAASLVFCWNRIRPSALDDTVMKTAAQVVLECQRADGAWSRYSDEPKPCVHMTAMAIHAISLQRPNGWESAASRAAAWLEGERHAMGYWHLGHGSAIMVTVLALDALSLARRENKATFRLGSSFDEVATDDPVYDTSSALWHAPQSKIFRDVALCSLAGVKIDVLLATATDVERAQVLRCLEPLPGRKKILRVVHENETYYVGRFGAYVTAMFKSTMGPGGPSGATLGANSALQIWEPKALIMVGIAFGADREKHGVGDILLAETVQLYDPERIGQTVVPRGANTSTGPLLFNRFENAPEWKFERPDKTFAQLHKGKLLSGSKLLDNAAEKKALVSRYPGAIGGEMEAAGIWAAATRNQTEWAIVKAVCDWADGKKHKDYQEMAAASAVSLCLKVLASPHALDGLHPPGTRGDASASSTPSSPRKRRAPKKPA